jgi:hypothetical protein
LYISYPPNVSVNLNVDYLMEFYFIDVKVFIHFVNNMPTTVFILSIITIIVLNDNHSGT